jgi:hypothetical protein
MKLYSFWRAGAVDAKHGLNGMATHPVPLAHGGLKEGDEAAIL